MLSGMVLQQNVAQWVPTGLQVWWGGWGVGVLVHVDHFRGSLPATRMNTDSPCAFILLLLALSCSTCRLLLPVTYLLKIPSNPLFSIFYAQYSSITVYTPI